MALSNGTDALLKEILSKMNTRASGSLGKTGKNTVRNDSPGGSSQEGQLTPPQAVVVLGIICGVLDVESVLFDKYQNLQILLTGSLKEKTELDILMDQLGAQPFDDVVKAVVGRLL